MPDGGVGSTLNLPAPSGNLSQVSFRKTYNDKENLTPC
ncbi:hypothetical protein LTSEGIV_2108 [Salmonella enterica subsp. enterica serovar Give str. S5-487]|nr:hypothetical protein LTSEGIV_2108 [Salmonella enterica subsp. enterica serovar Give str. S5-487]